MDNDLPADIKKGRHEHPGMTSRGMFDDKVVLLSIGLKEGQYFLDGGCADGHFSVAASRIVGDRGRVFALDIHTPSLDILVKNIIDMEIGNIEIMKHDLRLPIENMDGSLDHFFMSNVMHGFVHDREEEEVLSNISRTLKPGGCLTLIEWDKTNVVRGPPKDHRVSPEEMRDLIKSRGFDPVSVGKASNEHVVMTFRKVSNLH